jgi:hypothetical protein
MVICIVALFVLSILSIFSAKYRQPTKDAFKCVFKMITLRPCDVGLETKIKTAVTSKLMFLPIIGRFFYKNFKVISWLFTITFFMSLGYSAYSIYNLIIYGSCTPGASCEITTFFGICSLTVERYSVYILVAVLASIGIYLLIKKIRNKNKIIQEI